jgi:hypothetical protein
MIFSALTQESISGRDLESTYRSMLKPDALAIAKPYLIEEEHIFGRLLKNHARIKKNGCMYGWRRSFTVFI